MKANIMSNKLNTLVASALDAAHGYAKCIEAIRATLPAGSARTSIRTALTVPVATYYKVTLIAKVRGEGVIMDREHAKYDAASKAVGRLTASIIGQVSNQRDKVEAPDEMVTLARKLVKMAAEYEHSARVIAAALATARAE